MNAAVATDPQLLHATAGRIRLHLPDTSAGECRAIESALRGAPGVRDAQANPLTGNLLIRFDPQTTNEAALRAVIRAAEPEHSGDTVAAPEPAPALPERPRVTRAAGTRARTRIAVPGLDRAPGIARHVVTRLESHPGVRATANLLTGRVLVEFDTHLNDIDDLLAEITGVELPEILEGDRLTDPLDPGPTIQAATRTAGAALGFGFLSYQRLISAGEETANVAGAAQVSAVIGILQGLPFVRYGLRRLLGRTASDLLVNVPNLISLALSGNPLGLALTGAESVRLLTENIARRRAFQEYEERLTGVAEAQPDTTIRVETGERTPLAAQVVEGHGTAIGRDALPAPVVPGGEVPAGARLFGGPFVLHLHAGAAFTHQPRPAPVRPTIFDRYTRVLGPASLGYAALTAILTRSPARVFQALLLVNPRTALIGADNADLGASAYVLRAGVTIVGTRPNRTIRRPDLLLLDGPRVLTDGYELVRALPLSDQYDATEVLRYATSVAGAAGSPWGGALRAAPSAPGADGVFDGATARATVEGVGYTLGPPEVDDALPPELRLQQRGTHVLVLRETPDRRPLGALVLRPRLLPGVATLVKTCARHKVEIALLAGHNAMAAQAVARRAQVALLDGDDATSAVRERQGQGARVAVVSDTADAAEAFAACDLAIGLSSGRSSRFPARADLLAPDLDAVAAVIEAGARRDASVRDAVALSAIANGIGAIWGLRATPGIQQASRVVTVAALATIADGWARLRGGERPQTSVARLMDPRPERWGRRSATSVLAALHTTPAGLTTAQAAQRQRTTPAHTRRNALVAAVVTQLRSPLTAILAAGAGVSAFLGAPLDVAIIGAAILVNAAVGAWQEHQAGQAAEALAHLSAPTARVLRDGVPVTLPAAEIVPGDVLLLSTGNRVAADARILSAQGLEVDEAALTGESLPVMKVVEGGTDASHIVLEGSDVTVGTGTAVVFAVGAKTRMGSTAAALAVEETEQSPLSMRLSTMLRQLLPLAAVGGAIVAVLGLARGQALLPQLALGASIAIAAVPEGLPLLAGVGEAAVAKRLAGRNALVRRLAAVEALGRVDIACSDKTGTLTEGRLALRLVADAAAEAILPAPLSPDLRRVLLAGAFASPHPQADDAAAHPTDVAVVDGAQRAGLGDAIRAARGREVPFDPARSFHATVACGHLYVKGAVETLVTRCDRMREGGEDQPVGEDGRNTILARAESLAGRGLRVLMVAEGSPDADPDDPQNLVALGFLGIADPLRPAVPAAVRRCHEAGVRVMMLTGDHPATARAIATEAGILGPDDDIVTGDEIVELEDGALDRRLEDATVIARVTPLDKLRIVESLKRRGHTVAMTGDGVNDAPALRLADVGVAMGKGGTEVARQAADVVLADDDFATLVEALVEGRSFWRNIRRALGLLLGGNLGELGLVVGASVMGLAAPLVTRQILAVNLITDALPALSVALQPPATRDLAGLAREGTAALDAPLRRDVLQRGIATAVPSIAAFLLTLGVGGLPQARSVAFASIVATQLAQTLDVGHAQGILTGTVLSAVMSSAALLVAALTVPWLRNILSLVALPPAGWATIAVATLAAVVLSRVLALPEFAPTLSLPGTAWGKVRQAFRDRGLGGVAAG